MKESAEERKLKIEERKILLEEKEFELKKSELDSKKEKETDEKRQNKQTGLNPIAATIIVAVLGFITTTFGTIYNNYNTNKLENTKFQFDLIKKALERPTSDDRKTFLKFLLDLKLISDSAMSKTLDTLILNPEDLPNLSNTAPMGTQPIRHNTNINSLDFNLGALKAARGEIGQMEDTTFSNGGPAVEKYMLGGQGYGWSFGFISWCYAQNKTGNTPFIYAYSGNILKNELIKKGWYKSGNNYKPKPGDIYFIEFGDRGDVRHGGIVDSVINKDSFLGIEGNTNNNGAATGNGVYKRIRKFEKRISFGHVDI